MDIILNPFKFIAALDKQSEKVPPDLVLFREVVEAEIRLVRHRLHSLFDMLDLHSLHHVSYNLDRVIFRERQTSGLPIFGIVQIYFLLLVRDTLPNVLPLH